MPAHEPEGALREGTWWCALALELVREESNCCRHFNARTRRQRHSPSIVEVQRHRRSDRLSEPIEADDRQELFAREAALDIASAVAPSPVLVDEPGKQPDRGIVQGI